MDHSIKAAQLFLQGYNCAQAVAVAFCDVTGLDADYTAKLVSGFGGGMGRLREVCGAVSGMFMVLGHLYGYDTPGDDTQKKELYTRVQELAKQFEEINGSILLISQFTLYAATRKGRRPSFDAAARPETAEPLYEYFIQKLRSRGIKVETGIFGADMQVEIHNDGPVTMMVEYP